MGGTESCARDPMALTSPQVANVVPTMRLPGKGITFRIPLAQSVPFNHHRPGREFDALGCQHARCLHTADTVPSASTARSVCAMQPNLKPLLEVPRYARVALRRLVRDGSGCIRPPRTAFDCPAQHSTAPHSVRPPRTAFDRSALGFDSYIGCPVLSSRLVLHHCSFHV